MSVDLFYLKVLRQTNTTCLNIAVRTTDIVDPHNSALSILSLQCLFRRVCPNTKGKYIRSLSVCGNYALFLCLNRDGNSKKHYLPGLFLNQCLH